MLSVCSCMCIFWCVCVEVFGGGRDRSWCAAVGGECERKRVAREGGPCRSLEVIRSRVRPRPRHLFANYITYISNRVLPLHLLHYAYAYNTTSPYSSHSNHHVVFKKKNIKYFRNREIFRVFFKIINKYYVNKVIRIVTEIYLLS